MNVVFSLNTIFLALLTTVLLWVAFQIRDIIILVFVAMLLSLALSPLVERLQSKRISRATATLIVYLVFLVLLFFLLGYGFSPLVEQTVLFFSQLPRLLGALLASPLVEPVSQQIIEGLTSQLSVASGSLLKITLNVFSSIFSLITLVIFSFYFTLELKTVKKSFSGLFLNEETKKRVETIVAEIELKIGGWVRGELILVLVIGLLTYLGLTVLRVNYAVPLAVIAGLLEIIPVVGPVISAIPAAVVGFAASPLLGLGVIALFILIQQFENTFVVPRVMQKATGIDPVLTMLVIFTGGKLFGFLGALLSVPVTLVVIIVLKHFYYSKR